MQKTSENKKLQLYGVYVELREGIGGTYIWISYGDGKINGIQGNYYLGIEGNGDIKANDNVALLPLEKLSALNLEDIIDKLVLVGENGVRIDLSSRDVFARNIIYMKFFNGEIASKEPREHLLSVLREIVKIHKGKSRLSNEKRI